MRYEYYKDDCGGLISRHRYNWIKRNGTIPEGYEIHHKNWDKLDNRIENLSLMPVKRHRRFHRFFPIFYPNSEHIFKYGFTSKGYDNFLNGLPSKLRTLLSNKGRLHDIIKEWDNMWETK